jgi:hypothetical protein
LVSEAAILLLLLLAILASEVIEVAAILDSFDELETIAADSLCIISAWAEAAAFTIEVEEVTASLLACFDPVKDNKLALKEFGSTIRSLLIDLMDEDMAAFFSLILLDEYCIEVIFRSSDDFEAISDFAAASMVKAAEAEGAVLGLCLHRWRPQVQIWQIHFSSTFLTSLESVLVEEADLPASIFMIFMYNNNSNVN